MKKLAWITGRKNHVALLAVLLTGSLPLTAPAAVIYNTIPAPLPSNVVSQGYQTASIAEFGNLIQFAGTSRKLTRVVVTLSDWAGAADYPAFPGSSGPTWNHPLTLNLYNVNNSGANPAPGTVPPGRRPPRSPGGRLRT